MFPQKLCLFPEPVRGFGNKTQPVAHSSSDSSGHNCRAPGGMCNRGLQLKTRSWSWVDRKRSSKLPSARATTFIATECCCRDHLRNRRRGDRRWRCQLSDRRNASGVDPHLGIGKLSEQPIEDEEFDEPQNAEGRDVCPDDEDGSCQMAKMVSIGEVMRQ